MNPIRFSGLASTFVALIASAQPPMTSPVIVHIEGKVYLDGQRVEAPATLAERSVVRTEDGRTEIRLRSGALFLGENSSIRVIDNRPYNFNRLEMLNGSAVVTTGAGSGLVACEDAVTLSDFGVFRLDLHPLPGSQYAENDCRLRVYKGAAAVQLATVTAVLTSGKTMHLNRRCGDMIPTQEFDIEDIDGLDHWSRQRAGAADARRG
jgi:hypothetical protein